MKFTKDMIPEEKKKRSHEINDQKGKSFETSESWKYENEHCLQN